MHKLNTDCLLVLEKDKVLEGNNLHDVAQIITKSSPLIFLVFCIQVFHCKFESPSHRTALNVFCKRIRVSSQQGTYVCIGGPGEYA